MFSLTHLFSFTKNGAMMAILAHGMIGLSLVYFDQRVRQDGLDLLLMLDGVTNAASPGLPSSPVQPGEPASDAAGL